jgi:NTE family protein
LDSSPSSINSIENKEISSLDLGSLGINSINVDFQDNQSSVFSTCLSINFSRWRAELKYLKIKSETLANVNPTIDNSTYFSLLAT